MWQHQKFVPASVSDLIELETAATQAAERINRQGWPAPKLWPPFRSRSRFGTATDIDGRLLPNELFRYVDGSGPWLGQDGALYWYTGGTNFYRRRLEQMTFVYDAERVTKVIAQLDRLERQ